MTTYRLSRQILVFLYGLLAFMTLLGLVLVLNVVLRGGDRGPQSVVLVLWLGVLAWVWYAYLRIPYAIHWPEDGTIEITSPLRRLTLAPRDIVSLKGMFLSPGFLKLRHTGGKIILLAQMDGLHEFIIRVKAANPQVEVGAC
jgi:hypothetical protein